jgi:hypothetical protein
MSFPKFGAAGATESETHGFLTDQLEFRDGFETDIFSLKFTDNLRRGNPSFCAQTYGIGKSDDPTRNSLGVPLDTVTMAEEEQCTTPHMIATQPETSPALGDKLTYANGLIFFRKKITITINGRGDPPAGMQPADRGNTYAGEVLIKPAVGDSPAIQESGLYVSRVEVSKSVTDWQKFTVELTKYIGNTVANAQQNMISPQLFTEVELDAISDWYKLTRTTTLNGTDKANVEETVEIYDSSATP